MAMKYLKLFEEWKHSEKFRLYEAKFDPTKPSDYPALQTVCGDFEKLDEKKRQNVLISLFQRAYQKEGEEFNKNAGADLFNKETITVDQKRNTNSVRSVLNLYDVETKRGKDGWKDGKQGVLNQMLQVYKNAGGDTRASNPTFYALLCGTAGLESRKFSDPSKNFYAVLSDSGKKNAGKIELDSENKEYECNLLSRKQVGPSLLVKAINLEEKLFDISEGRPVIFLGKKGTTPIQITEWEKKIATDILKKLEEASNELKKLDDKKIIEGSVEIPEKYIISFSRDEEGKLDDNANIMDYPVSISVFKWSKPEAEEGQEAPEPAWEDDEDFQPAKDSTLGMVMYFFTALANGKEEIKYLSATGRESYKEQVMAVFNKEAQTEAFAFKGTIDGKKLVAGKTTGVTTVTDKTGTEYVGQINFEFNSATLNAEDVAFIKSLDANYFGGAKAINIVGHTDGAGSAKVNIALSKQRADAVLKVFKTNPVFKTLAKVKIATGGKGYSEPIIPDEGGTLLDYASVNRRVEFILDNSKPDYTKFKEALKNKFKSNK